MLNELDIPQEFELTDTSFEADKPTCDDEEYSNAVDPVTAGLEAAGKLAELGTTALENIPEVKRELKARCGRAKPPLFGKKRKAEFIACRDSFYAQVARDKALQNELLKGQMEMTRQQDKQEEEAKSNRTMWIIGGTLAAITLIIGGVVIVKSVKK